MEARSPIDLNIAPASYVPIGKPEQAYSVNVPLGSPDTTSGHDESSGNAATKTKPKNGRRSFHSHVFKRDTTETSGWNYDMFWPTIPNLSGAEDPVMSRQDFLRYAHKSADYLAGVSNSALEGLVFAFRKVKDYTFHTAVPAVAPTVNAAYDKTKDITVNTVVPTLKPLAQKAKDHVTTIVIPAFYKAKDSADEVIDQTWEQYGPVVKSTALSVWEAISRLSQRLKSGIYSAVENDQATSSKVDEMLEARMHEAFVGTDVLVPITEAENDASHTSVAVQSPGVLEKRGIIPKASRKHSSKHNSKPDVVPSKFPLIINYRNAKNCHQLLPTRKRSTNLMRFLPTSLPNTGTYHPLRRIKAHISLLLPIISSNTS